MPDPTAPARAEDAARAPHPRFGAAFLAAFLVTFVAMGLWSLATPLFGGPDEPAHVIKAAAVVRGQLVGEVVGGAKSPFARVQVPEFYATTRAIPNCFHQSPTTPASCAAAPFGSATPSDVLTYVARYPPLYYALVGLPSLLGDGTTELYLMRLLSAALSASLIALAMAAVVAWGRSRLALGGIVVAATPTVLFLGGVVNPTGLEIAAAICAWTTGSLLVVERAADPPVGLVVSFGLAAGVFELVRGLSLLWLALTLVFLVALRGGALGSLLRRRAVLVAGAAVLAIGAVALSWVLVEHALNVYSRTPVPLGIPESQILETAFARNDAFWHQMIGVFGWVDTTSPLFTYVAWTGLLGAVVLGAAVLARLRDALVLGALAIAVVVLPVVISASQVHTDGFTWSGRDTLPLAVGLPILAGVLAADRLAGSGRSATRGLLSAVVVLAGPAQVAAYFAGLRRNAVGTAGPDFGFLVSSPFNPPLGNAGLLALEIAVVLVAVGLVARAARRGPAAGDAAGATLARTPDVARA